jgi:Uma2 family endonuclease
MLDAQAIAPDRVRPITRAEYERLVALGAFEDERLELLEGALVTMSPQGTRHAEAIGRLNRILTVALVDRAAVRIQSPLGAGDQSLPEPDVAVVPLGDYSDAHPERALLVVEVAETSIKKDRAKATIYASAGVTDYWIVNLADRVIEVHRDPHGGRYRNVSTYDVEHEIAPQSFPEFRIRAADVIP